MGSSFCRQCFKKLSDDTAMKQHCSSTLQVAYKAVMQSVTSSDKAGYEALLKIYRETDVSQERTRVLSKKALLAPLYVK
jgi:hypothetical protein